MKNIVREYKSTYFEAKDKKQFKKWLVENDLSLGDAAKKMGVSIAYLSCVISGQRALTTEMVAKFWRLGYQI